MADWNRSQPAAANGVIWRLVRYAQADIDAFVTQCDQRGYPASSKNH